MEAWDTPEAYDELMKLIPYKRIGEPDDIARRCLAGLGQPDYINGARLFVDGGMTSIPDSRPEAERSACG